MRALSAGLVVMLLTLPAAAQTPESVTVTGTRSRQVLDKFVESFAAPNRLTGKIARWEDGVCPVAAGLKPDFLNFITQRLKDVAAKAGAPVNDRATCKPNIEIVFTTTPQALIDNVRKQNQAYLGYADNGIQIDRLATVMRPIQAWYTTATRDERNKTVVDSAKPSGIGMRIPCSLCPGGYTYLPNAEGYSVSGSRLGDGLHSALYHVIIVADPAKLVDYEMGAVGDYIAMLALTQLSSLDTCQALPSIVNLLAGGCAQKPEGLTENDAAYLRGLYHMGPGRNLRNQEDEVAYQMDQAFQGR
jgi:hypothetical protein